MILQIIRELTMELLSGHVEVHVFRRTKEGLKYLMLKRGEKEIYPGLWQIVTGKIKAGEKAYETALREVLEETGLRPKRFWVAPKVNQFYSAERDAIYNVPVFAAEVDSDKVKICDEHCEYQWVDPSEARELLPWEEQRKALDIVTGYVLKMPDYLDMVEVKVQ